MKLESVIDGVRGSSGLRKPLRIWDVCMRSPILRDHRIITPKMRLSDGLLSDPMLLSRYAHLIVVYTSISVAENSKQIILTAVTFLDLAFCVAIRATKGPFKMMSQQRISRELLFDTDEVLTEARPSVLRLFSVHEQHKIPCICLSGTILPWNSWIIVHEPVFSRRSLGSPTCRFPITWRV